MKIDFHAHYFARDVYDAVDRVYGTTTHYFEAPDGRTMAAPQGNPLPVPV